MWDLVIANEIREDDSRFNETKVASKLGEINYCTLRIILTEELQKLNYTSVVQCLQNQSSMFIEFFERFFIFMHVYVLNDLYSIDLNFSQTSFETSFHCLLVDLFWCDFGKWWISNTRNGS